MKEKSNDIVAGVIVGLLIIGTAAIVIASAVDTVKGRTENTEEPAFVPEDWIEVTEE